MATTPTSWAIQPPRSAYAPSCADDSSDGQLLDDFIEHKDESAFAELVRRHGAMVLGVCRRVLDNPHDAEDCFQAAFLVLVRKATTIQPRQMVGNWLYGVAYRTALEAKKMAARRRYREKKKFDMPPPETDEDRWQDLKPLLDQEMSRLPDKYRFVLVACDIEGRTRKDVAQSLEVPEGTIASRLARARTMLAKRLTRHNLTMSVGVLSALLAEQASAAFVPAELTASTTHAAALLAAGKPVAGIVSGNIAALMNAAARPIVWTNVQIASAVVLILAILGLGVSQFLPTANADKKPNAPIEEVALRNAMPEHVQDCVLTMVDTGSMTIQAAKANDEGVEISLYDLQVEPTTTILIDGQKADIADLKVGDCVSVKFERGADGKARALRIQTSGESLGGVVQAMNENTVTIQSGKDIVKKTYDPKRFVWVFIDGKKGKLADVKAKMQVDLYVSVRKPEVLVIAAAGPKVAGVVQSIDTDRRTLSLGKDSIAIAPDALIQLDGKKAQLADLRAGMGVTLLLSAETENRNIVGITTVKR